MDKASIIKDAIEYIQELHEQERKLMAEIGELEGGKQTMATSSDVSHAGLSHSRTHRRRTADSNSIEVLEVS